MSRRCGCGHREGTLRRCLLVVLDVCCGIPLEEHLSTVPTEAALAQSIPPVVEVADVGAEQLQRRLTTAYRRVRDSANRAEVSDVFLDHGWYPCPRELVGVVDEPYDHLLTLLDGAELQVSAELLVPPSREHVFDGLLLGMQWCHRLDQDDASAPVDPHDTPS